VAQIRDGELAGMGLPTLEELQHWTGVIGRAQQMMLEHAVRAAGAGGAPAMPDMTRLFEAWSPPRFNPEALIAAQTGFWNDSIALWQRFLDPARVPDDGAAERDRRFAAPAWREHPVFALLREAYQVTSQAMIAQVEAIEGLDARQRDRLRFATRAYVDAASPSNFALTNPEALQRIVETRGESFLTGLSNMLGDLARGQLTQTPHGAFEVGRDLAATPGKVIHETPLYQLIQYAPTTPAVQRIPLVIFPPWINRFYILDLGPKKSFVRWAVAQGLTVFMVSWKSADADLAQTTLDDYVSAQLDAIAVVRDLLDVEQTHVIGYCVAGTVLAATLALLAARGDDSVASATFFTAQVDFTDAGELGLFVDDSMLDLLGSLADEGFLDGRYMAAVFNMLRGRDLIWSYVVNNYLLGEAYRPFDLLHWNGDITNLPAVWHHSYLRDFYRDNLMVRAGALSVLGVLIDLSRVTVPSYIQAGREDHIAPAASVWKMTEHFRGPMRFVLAGSGHIAGVVNPPEAGKYQYWTSERPQASLADFIADATETKGSWWPDWSAWIGTRSGGEVAATGARVPGEGARPAIEDAPGRYVRMR
jgi:polyhydroxyalkanoate synthase